MSVQTADQVLAEGNSLFVDEDYEGALKKFNEAIEMEDTNSDFFAKRSFCFYKLADFPAALKDANKAIELDPTSATAFLRKGMAAFSLEEYNSALEAFNKAGTLNPAPPANLLKTWIRKCDAELEGASGSDAKPAATPTPAPAQKSVATPTPAAKPVAPPAASSASQIRHDWFQTATHVTVCVLAKGVKKEALEVNIQAKELSVTIKLPASEYQLNLDLAGPVDPTQSKFEVLSTKVEIKMKKAEAVQWKSLENQGEKLEAWGTVQDGPSKGLSYPSSSKKAVAWDSIKPEEEKLEGDAALNQVFSGIFKNATDEQRMAMQKSFQESGGTVLSTNWDEVGKAPVKGSAPNGMEMRNWSDLNHK